MIVYNDEMLYVRNMNVETRNIHLCLLVDYLYSTHRERRQRLISKVMFVTVVLAHVIKIISLYPNASNSAEKTAGNDRATPVDQSSQEVPR